MKHKDRGSAAILTEGQNLSWISKLWKLKLQRKLLFLCWRIVRNIVATRRNLYRRQIIKEDSCPFCDEVETSFHAFVECDIAARFWSRWLPLPDNGAEDNRINTGEWCSKIFLQLQDEDRHRFVVGLWIIWLARNVKVFEQMTIEVDQLLFKAGHLLMQHTETDGEGKGDFEASVNADTNDLPYAAIGEQDYSSGSELGRKKATLQFDGSWRYSQRLAGGGVIIFDNNGMALLAKAKNFTWGNRAKEIEALSLEMGMDMAMKIGIDSLTIEGDAEILLNEISGKNMNLIEDRSTISDIICLIKDKASNFGSIHWHWIGRDKNTKAHKLASLGISIEGEELWLADSIKHYFDPLVTNSKLLAPVL